MSTSPVNGMPNSPALPEPKKFTCAKCGTYPMGAETTLYVYKKQAWFNHLSSTCPRCNQTYRVWYLKMEDIRYMMVNNTRKADDKLVVIHADFCDDLRIKRQFCLENNKPLPPDLYISPRKQKDIDSKVEFFAHLLDRIEPKTGS